MPSMVVISSLECITAKERQEFTRRPLIWTVQAPHWPWSQPFLVPGRLRFSRRQSRRVVRGAISRRWSFPLTRRGTVVAPSAAAPASCAVGAGDGSGEARRGGAVWAVPAGARGDKNDQLVTRPTL